MEFIKKNKSFILIGLGVLALVVLLFVTPAMRKNIQAKQEEERKIAQQKEEEEKKKQANQNQEGVGTDKYLMNMQPRLVERFGEAPEGFIRNIDGTLQSLGDKDMSAEDVLYAYIRALSILDFSTVEKYSRNSTVMKTYNEFFNSRNINTDYKDSFIRKMYKQTLLSIEMVGVENQAVFASNKVVYTVKLRMLDLSNKDFWLEDKDKIFQDLSVIDSEGDDTKSENYIYNYIVDKYSKKGTKITKDIVLDVTLEKFADLGSGFLVSIDKEIDDYARYKNGKLFSTYVLEQFRDYRYQKMQNEEEQEDNGGDEE